MHRLCNAIWGVLRKHGIRLAIDRHKLLSTDELANSPWSQDTPPPETDATTLLKNTPVLGQLEEPVLKQIAARAIRRDFTPPQCVYLQGDSDTSIYIVTDGRLSILQNQANGSEAELGTLDRGAVFGLSACLGDSPREETVQAVEYSVVYEVDVDALADSLQSSAALTNKLREYLDSTRREYADRLARHLDALKHREHHRTRADILASLRAHVRDVLKPGLVTETIRSLVTRHTEKTILKAVMAAAALVSIARGEIDDLERDYVVGILDSLELLHHTDRATGMEVFNGFAELLTRDPEKGSADALSAIRHIANNDKIAHVVLGIAHGVTGLHGAVTEGERAAVEKVATVLGLPHEAADLAASIEGLSQE
jgi:CRP-like cAMP-binding protein